MADINDVAVVRTGFYATAIDAGRVAYLLGPFDAHEAALAAVPRAQELAYANDPRAWFYAYGTARVTSLHLPAAVFQKETEALKTGHG